jgi:hypothetical protein
VGCTAGAELSAASSTEGRPAQTSATCHLSSATRPRTDRPPTCLGLVQAPTTKDPTEPLLTVRPGIYEVEDKTWRVQKDPKQRGLAASRLGLDGQWRPVTNGVRTLRQALTRQDPLAARATTEAQEIAQALSSNPPHHTEINMPVSVPMGKTAQRNRYGSADPTKT